jgi:peptidoglycan glycosyltransferase
MKKVHNLNRVALVTLIGFLICAVSVTYWSVFAASSMSARSDNPRLVEAELAIKRGALLDRNGVVLAQNQDVSPLPSGWILQQRVYPHLEAAHVVGYYSVVHGVGGTEAAYDKILRGDDLRDSNTTVTDMILHRAEVGSDIRLTVDLALQKVISDAIGDRRGAGVLLSVPSGAVLAMVSKPTYDPNQLAYHPNQEDKYYDALRADQTAPLLNRVTQGVYQPGGVLQTVVLAAMLSNKQTLNGAVAEPTGAIQVNGLTLACARSGRADTLLAAYALACPSAFTVATVESPADVQAMIDAFGLSQAPTLVDYQTLTGSKAAPLTDSSDTQMRVKAGAGQGDLTVTPLQMALVAATIANHGNMIVPYMGDSIRRPGSATWTPIARSEKSPAVLSADVADVIATAMKSAVTNGSAGPAAQDGLTIYGHASIAYTGQTADSWFIGFVQLPDGSAIAAAVVIEDSNDAGVSAKIGGTALKAAAHP